MGVSPAAGGGHSEYIISIVKITQKPTGIKVHI